MGGEGLGGVGVGAGPFPPHVATLQDLLVPPPHCAPSAEQVESPRMLVVAQISSGDLSLLLQMYFVTGGAGVGRGVGAFVGPGVGGEVGNGVVWRQKKGSEKQNTKCSSERYHSQCLRAGSLEPASLAPSSAAASERWLAPGYPSAETDWEEVGSDWEEAEEQCRSPRSVALPH